FAHGVRSATDDPRLSVESLLEAARADDTKDNVAMLAAPLETRIPPAARRSSRFGTWPLATAGLAAVFALAASLLWWAHDGQLFGIPRTYRTAHGEQSVRQLPDGSTLYLNT